MSDVHPGLRDDADANVATLTANGPTELVGDIDLVLVDDEVRSATSTTLCRCGQSSHKPFCDGSHERAGFRDAGALPQESAASSGEARGKLTITVKRNGPLKCIGPLTLTGTDGRATTADETFLCRCGASGRKPYCDGTHKRIGFTG